MTGAVARGTSVLVFVYGTLKEGFPNHGRNPGRRLAGEFRTRQRFPFYVVRLPNEERAPWLVHRPGDGHQVVGQVFEVGHADLAALDRFEEVGLPTGYVRVGVELEAVGAPGATWQAQAYLKEAHHLADCLAVEGPFPEYTLALSRGYRLDIA